MNSIERGNRDGTEALREALALFDSGRIREAITVLTDVNRRARSSELERELVRLRQEGCAWLPAPSGVSCDRILEPIEGSLLETPASGLRPEIVRRGFAQSGCVLVRGLLPQDRVARLVTGIEAVFEAYDESVAGRSFDDQWYWPFPMPALISPSEAGPSINVSPGAPPAGHIPPAAHRRVTRQGAGVWAVDSPRMLFELFELVDDTGLGSVMTEVLGERPFLSANKCTLRRVPPDEMSGGWHQDGAFLGNDVAALNIWIALTRCGRDAPGLDLVPRRFDRILQPGGEDAYFKWSLSDADVAEAAGDAGVARPQFEAGDALLFDHRLVHRTATSPDMVRPRHAIEAWFFGPSAFPASQLPLVF